eukprot:gene3868-7718_t
MGVQIRDPLPRQLFLLYEPRSCKRGDVWLMINVYTIEPTLPLRHVSNSHRSGVVGRVTRRCLRSAPSWTQSDFFPGRASAHEDLVTRDQRGEV